MGCVSTSVSPGCLFAKLVGVLFGHGVVATVPERPDEKVFLGVNLDRVAGRGGDHQGWKPAGDFVLGLAGFLVGVFGPHDSGDVGHVRR